MAKSCLDIDGPRRGAPALLDPSRQWGGGHKDALCFQTASRTIVTRLNTVAFQSDTFSAKSSKYWGVWSFGASILSSAAEVTAQLRLVPPPVWGWSRAGTATIIVIGHRVVSDYYYSSLPFATFWTQKNTSQMKIVAFHRPDETSDHPFMATSFI
jgi:hypothetical protein